MPFSCGDEAQKPDLGAGSRAAPGRWDGVTRTPGGQSKHGQGGQISRCMDGTSGNKFPAAEPPSPGLEALDFLSGAFWKVMLVLVAVRKTKVVVVVAVGTEVRPHPQEVRAQGARVCVPWPSLPSYRGALLSQLCRLWGLAGFPFLGEQDYFTMALLSDVRVGGMTSYLLRASLCLDSLGAELRPNVGGVQGWVGWPCSGSPVPEPQTNISKLQVLCCEHLRRHPTVGIM